MNANDPRGTREFPAPARPLSDAAQRVQDALRAGGCPFVRDVTGYAIGGIPPVGHATSIDTIVDAHLLTLGELWAAAGHPNSLFPLTSDELVRMTRGRVAEVAE